MRFAIGICAMFLAAGCSSKFKTYDGPEVTGIAVFKEDRRLVLVNNQTPIIETDFELGFAPSGHKEVEGDGRTPEGTYYINRKNPNSAFHLSIGISYPNAADRAHARSMGKSPGGDIFIHGTPGQYQGQSDWTWGCIAVDNSEMEQIFAMVDEGTPITIYP
ncbi:MAG: L,D-transpeptidase family protein [Planktomarina sp.]